MLKLLALWFLALSLHGAWAASIVTQFTGNNEQFVVDHLFTIVPPDGGGAVGPGFAVQANNGQVAFYTTGSTGAVSAPLAAAPMTDRAFWTSAGFPDVAGVGVADARVAFDPASGRFIVSAMTLEPVDNRILLAISNDQNPTHGFTATSIPAQTGQFADFPTLAVRDGKVLIATNNFPLFQNQSSTSLFVVPVASLTGGTTTGLVRNDNLSTATYGFTLQIGGGPTATGPITFVGADFNGAASVQVGTVSSGGIVSPVVTTVATTLSGFPNPVTPPGAAFALDAGDNRIPGSSVQIGDLLYFAQVAPTAGPNAITWTVLNVVTGTIAQSGVISSPGLDFTYPAIAANPAGDFFITFNGLSATSNIGDYYVECHATGAIATCGSPVLIAQSLLAAYTNFGGPPLSRWGDYNALVNDPSDASLFWSFVELAAINPADPNCTLDPGNCGLWTTEVAALRVQAAVPEPPFLPVFLTFGLAGTAIRLSRRRA